ncbi:MAG: DinB family protein [bacterium]|jgi:uncharacterized damage-inducible protein DinB
MFTRIEDFLATWKQHSSGTQRYFDALTDSSLQQKSAAGERTIARAAWHIVTSLSEMAGRTGLKLSGPSESAPIPKTAKEITEGYRQLSHSLAEEVRKNWNDASLQVEDDMYGSNWKRGLTLRIIIDHEIHHRGQLSILMRQAGLKVPGIFGPSLEEWSQHGMKPPEI